MLQVQNNESLCYGEVQESQICEARELEESKRPATAVISTKSEDSNKETP